MSPADLQDVLIQALSGDEEIKLPAESPADQCEPPRRISGIRISIALAVALAAAVGVIAGCDNGGGQNNSFGLKRPGSGVLVLKAPEGTGGGGSKGNLTLKIPDREGSGDKLELIPPGGNPSGNKLRLTPPKEADAASGGEPGNGTAGNYPSAKKGNNGAVDGASETLASAATPDAQKQASSLDDLTPEKYKTIKEHLLRLAMEKNAERTRERNRNMDTLLASAKGAGADIKVTITRPDNVNDPWRNIGDPPIEIFPYSKVKSVCTPEEYLAFLRLTVTSPEDAAKLTNHYIIPYKEGDAFNTTDPVETLETGTGDCYDLSEIARDLMEALGKRTGKSYKPRTISANLRGYSNLGHAICVFERDGKSFAIDQGEPEEYDGNIVNASSRFQEMAARGALIFHEIRTYPGKGITIKWDLDSSLKKSYSRLDVYLTQDSLDPSKFDPNVVLPMDWKNYKEVLVFFGEQRKKEGVAEGAQSADNYIFYRKGVTTQIKYRGGTTDADYFDDNGDFNQRTYKSGPYKYVWYRGGKEYAAQTFDGQYKHLNEETPVTDRPPEVVTGPPKLYLRMNRD